MIDREYFKKRVTDTNKLCGFYMDDYTADLLYDRFHDKDLKDFEAVLEECLKTGEKVTFKVLHTQLNKIKRRQIEEKEYNVVHECIHKNCKECDPDTICVEMAKAILPLIAKLLKGDIKYEEIKNSLNEKYPDSGFNKKNGTCTGVIRNEDGTFTSVYQYD